ncbi:MAG TPA: hypothetical protein VKQ05_14005 [Gemmatimonadales bacterium]|nr:hypothetical protein [Gemmatimonadales bacterium]
MIASLVALPLTLLSLQQGIAQRLAGRVSPNVAAAVEGTGTAASARGLPVDPLIQKAIEGGAKGIADDRVIAAVNLVVSHLDTAAAALREGGASADTLTIAAGAFAVSAGLSGSDITALARVGATPAALTVGLRVAGTLAALGVPPAENIGLVSVSLRSGKPTADLLLLPASVESEVAKGSTPAAAAAGLSRAAAAQGRHGPPPGHGQPPHPPTPSHP